MMGTDGLGAPTETEKERFLKKIQEWKSQGFNTDDLEDLLENDFNEFLRRRHQILKQQLPDGRSGPYEEKPRTEIESAEPSGEEVITSKPTTTIPPVAPDTEEQLPTEEAVEEKKGPEEGLLLLGEPLIPEDEPYEEPADEGVIFVAKPRHEKRSKVHRTREITPVDKREKAISKAESETEAELEEDIESSLEDFEEEEELLEGEEETEIITREKGPKTPRKKAGEQTPGGRIAAAAVVIIVILSLYYFGIVNPIIDFNIGDGNGNGGGKVTADFEIIPAVGNYPGTIILLDASNSSGRNLNYAWTLDDDFRIVEGTRQSNKLNGYYVSTEDETKTKYITLEVSNMDDEDSLTKELSLQPVSFEITEEKLRDNGKFQVSGSLNSQNPNGIVTYSTNDADITINNVNIDFHTELGQDMTMELISAPNTEDGFQQTHSVYKRSIQQNLKLSGTITGTIRTKNTIGGIIPADRSYPFSSDLDGSMRSTDYSYTDLTTYNTLLGHAKNNLEITIPIEFENYKFDEYTFYSNDTIESYPDLRKNPMKFQLTELSDDELKIGDQGGIQVGEINYIWYAKKVEYVFNKPAIEVNLTINSSAMNRYNLQKFFSAFWIAEGISQPVKTHLYSVHSQKGNTTTLNYISEMTDFEYGISKISDYDCTVSTPDGHYYARRPGVEYVDSTNWTFLPPTGQSNRNESSSFKGFTHEQALAMAKNNQTFINYNATHSGSYVVSGYCTASGDGDVPAGELVWNLTFGTKDSDKGLNIVISESGSITIEDDVTIDVPPNSTDDFDPLLSFASSEDILLNYDDKEFYNLIFDSNNKIDFNNLNYGIGTNLEYPNVDITSIWFIEHTKYCYLITFNERNNNQQRIVRVALDAETGQLLFYWDHTDSGLELF